LSKLAVIVLGHRRSGKSTTWNALFERTVRTGIEIRELTLTNDLTIPVFLVSGSPEERQLYVGDIISDANPRVVLCSLQYTEAGRESIQFFVDNGYRLFVQWLNPGYSDQGLMPDFLGFLPFLLYNRAVVSIRDGQQEPYERVREIRDYLIGWASSRRIGS
jgi:hypothetical protein